MELLCAQCKKYFLWTTSLKFYTTVKEFSSSVVKNVATNGHLQLVQRMTPKTCSNPLSNSIHFLNHTAELRLRFFYWHWVCISDMASE